MNLPTNTLIPKKKRILHLDDDLTVTSYYREVLSNEAFGYGMDVEIVTCPQLFMERIIADRNWDLIVLDVMMPHPEWHYFSHEQSDEGLLTGALLVGEVRKILPAVPIILLTNRPEKDVAPLLTDQSIPMLLKHDFPPFEFADHVKSLLEPI